MREKSVGASRMPLFFIALILSVVALSSLSLAITYYGHTDKILYEKNTLINYTAYSDVNLSTNTSVTSVSVSIVNSSGVLFNSSNVSATENYFSTTLNASVNSSGEYIIRANFTYNGTSYKNDIIVKVSGAKYFSIFSDRSSYYPNEQINFTVKALDKNGLDASGEPVTVKLAYANYTTISQASGVTSSLGEYSSTITAPSSDGSYMFSVNDWLAFKTVTVGGFELVSYSGDGSGNTKSKFDANESAFIYVDLLTPNKTRYSGLESITVNVTLPGGTTNATTLTFTNDRLNYSVRANETGQYLAKVTVISNSKSASYNFTAASHELKASATNSRGTNIFFPNENVTVAAKVYNVSTGEILTANFSNATLWSWKLQLWNSSGFVMNLPNSTPKAADNSYPFSFNLTNISTGSYFIKVWLNRTETTEDIILQDYEAQAMPVDQDYQFKSVFLSGKSNVRIIATLSNLSGNISVTNITVLGIKKSGGGDITGTLSITTNVTDYKLTKAGIVQFATPADAGWYYARMLVNGRYVAETWFAVKAYSTCSQLTGYKWFVGTNEDASLQVTVSAAQETGFMESIGGKDGTKGGEVTGGSSSFGAMYGMSSCTSNSTSTSGNVSSNVQVAVSKIVNTLTSEDYTKKLSSLPSGTTSNNGTVTLNITKPSGGWSGGTYIVEFDLKDSKNNTDRGFAWFNVKSLWVNVWPKQQSGYWRWYFGPKETFTFDVYSYSATNSWYNWGSEGTGDMCDVVNVYYQGSGAEWFWPPKLIDRSNYNYTCVNASAGAANGRFNLNVTPNSAFKSGYYLVRAKVNTSTTSDTGDGWFSVKVYNVYLKSNSTNWYDSWYVSSGSNVTYKLEVTYANQSTSNWDCGWNPTQSCSGRVSETLNVSVTKMLKYDQWMPTEYAKSKYNASVINATNNASNWNMSITTGNGTILLVPRGGTGSNSWESGYYSLVVEVTGPEGTETGNAWFESRPFFVETTIVNSSAPYASKWRLKSTDANITVNVSAASKPSWMKYYSSYGNNTYQYSDANITNITLSRYSYSDWRMQGVNVTGYSPINISGVTVVNITPGSLSAGSYNLEITLRDNQSNEAKGYAWFEVKDFTLSAQTADWRWKFNNSENITLSVTACDADTWWCSGSGLTNVTVNVTKVQRTGSWPYTDVSGWASSSNTTTANGATLKIYRTSSNWTSGYYTAEVTGVSGTSTQTANVWFEIESFSLNAWASKWEYGMRENVTLNAQVSQSVTVDDVSVICGYSPNSRAYSKSAETLNVTPTSINAGTPNITLTPSLGRWNSGYCSGQITASAGGTQKTQWFSFNVQPIKVTVNNYNKYVYLKNETVQLTVNPQQAINFSIILNRNPYDGGSGANYTNFILSARNFTNTSYNNILNITPNGTWGYGNYNGQMNISLPDDASSSSIAYLNFRVDPPYTIGTFYPTQINKTQRGQNFTFYVSSNSSAGGQVSGLNVTLNSIKYWPYNCYNNCNYQADSGYTATNATANSTGYVTINITRNSDWNYGSNALIFTINDSVELVNATAWVWAG